MGVYVLPLLTSTRVANQAYTSVQCLTKSSQPLPVVEHKRGDKLCPKILISGFAQPVVRVRFRGLADLDVEQRTDVDLQIRGSRRSAAAGYVVRQPVGGKRVTGRFKRRARDQDRKMANTRLVNRPASQAVNYSAVLARMVRKKVG